MTNRRSIGRRIWLRIRATSFDSIVQLITAIAVAVTALLIWREVKLIHASVDVDATMRDRPALLFDQDVRVSVSGGSLGPILRVTLKVTNQGSGNAYAVEWWQADQIPPLHSSLVSKDEAFSSYSRCKEAFMAAGSRHAAWRNMVIGTGLSHTLSFDHETRLGLRNSELVVKKYVAAFYESETGRQNATIVGVEIRLSSKGVASVEVHEIGIVRDPRS